MRSVEEIKDFIVECLEEKKAEGIIVMHLSNNILAKYMIIASGRSIKNIGAIADYISLELKRKEGININTEGIGNSDWVLIDAGDIIVHIFHPESRNRFKLEELWGHRTNHPK